MSVIVLNTDNSYIGSITWQASIILLCKGKVEVIKESDRVVRNVTRTVEFVVPKIVRLIRFIKQVYKKSNVPYSKRAVFVRDKYKCQYCGKQLDKRQCTVDHIVPKSLGGESAWNNCATACTECNNLKGDLPLGKGNSLRIKDANGNDHHLVLRRAPQKPSVGDFLRMKAMDIVLDDIQ